MKQYQQIIKRLIEARKLAGLTQTQVALMVGLSMASSFSDIETGKNPLSVERLLELAKIYDVSVEWLLTGVNPYFDPQTIINSAGRMSDDLNKILEVLSMKAAN